jgi:hypothetical protein
MTKRMVGAACLWGIAVAAGLVLAAPPSVLPAGARLDDERLGPPRTLDGYFPLAPVADAETRRVTPTSQAFSSK